MKKIVILIFLFFVLISETSAAQPTCQDFKDKYFSYINSGDSEGADRNYNLYNSCIDEFNTYFEKAYDMYNDGNFKGAIENYLIAYPRIPGDESINYNLGLSYFYNGEYKNAQKYFKFLSLNSVDLKIKSYIFLAKIEYYLEDNIFSEDVENIFNKAYSLAETEDDRTYITTEKEKFYKTLSATVNDPLFWTQYYIDSMNIQNAWSKVGNNNKVIVAVIDDGIYLNHPDLQGKIWENPNAKYGTSKVIDFVGDGIDNLAAGEHGTMVSGIIAATQNNNIGIAGVAKNVEIMPLRVFDLEGNTKEDSEGIIEAIDYAIKNGANIINLSLGQSQFKYSTKYDEIIKKAYDNNVIVVIAAGNGDIYTNQQTGVNLSENPIAPVCNNGGNYNKYSIGVYASNKEGWRTDWTNYGNCAPFMAPGVDIVSTSVPIFNETYGGFYNRLSGTSFSAPIISGIIALGYNQYGEIPADEVYDALYKSLIENEVGNYLVDASKYLDELGKYSSEINNNQNYQNLKSKYRQEFQERVGDKLSKFPRLTLTKLLNQINTLLKTDLKEDLKAKVEALKEIIEENL